MIQCILALLGFVLSIVVFGYAYHLHRLTKKVKREKVNDHVALISSKTGGMWKVRAKEGYHINRRAKHVNELVLKNTIKEGI